MINGRVIAEVVVGATTNQDKVVPDLEILGCLVMDGVLPTVNS
jgi:hypothetical protein